MAIPALLLLVAAVVATLLGSNTGSPCIAATGAAIVAVPALVAWLLQSANAVATATAAAAAGLPGPRRIFEIQLGRRLAAHQ